MTAEEHVFAVAPEQNVDLFRAPLAGRTRRWRSEWLASIHGRKLSLSGRN
jgi:hypothetical protein